MTKPFTDQISQSHNKQTYIIPERFGCQRCTSGDRLGFY
jgi:hypothetical protein